jgi:hypothetical protein
MSTLKNEVTALNADANVLPGMRVGPSWMGATAFEVGVPIATVYETCYQGIFRTNNLIAKVEGNTPAKVIIIAEAKALRACYYFEPVTMFGDVPLVTIELSCNEYAKAPDLASAVWTLIETDLTDAIAGLKVKSQGDAWRISKGTAQALLGKAYLYQKKYSQAGDYRLDGDLPYDCDGFVRLKYGTWASKTSQTAQPELNYGTEYIMALAG